MAGTSWCGTVLCVTLEGSHGHPRFSFSPSDAVPLLLLLMPASVPPATVATFAAFPIDVAATHAAAATATAAIAAVAAAVLAVVALAPQPMLLLQ